jgi:tRNA-2-methylthio-N6-dimethylallyladenosine synthase
MNTKYVSEIEIDAQKQFADQCRELLTERFGRTPRALVHSFGCQQNVNDGEKLMGMLAEMGCGFTDDLAEADIVLYNTCAVRENAEQKVFGILGQATHQKASHKEMLIGLCGCMAQQEHVSDKIRKSFPGVDLVFGTHVVHKFPELMLSVLQNGRQGKRKRVFDIEESDGVIAEGLPAVREDTVRAGLPIMYGCNNFCTYCVVPLVRGRERSRRSADILAEARELIAQGYKEITLLGQNVNSYGKDLEDDLTFPQLLEAVASLPGDFWVRFMTSHPKDCTKELIDVIARTPKICSHIHLPVQSGSDRVLKAMNRHYTRAQYLDTIRYAKETIPGVTFTSDIIVGFPGETYEEFQETLSLIREVGYNSLFTFIYSPRVGTRAASMEDPIPAKEKSRWFSELLETQKECGMGHFDAMVGRTVRVLCEGEGKLKNGVLGEVDLTGEQMVLMGRNEQGMVVDFIGERALIGQFVEVKITEAANWALAGVLA